MELLNVKGDQTVNTGLICLQKDYLNAINTQNVSYLAILITSLKNISSTKGIQEVILLLITIIVTLTIHGDANTILV
jgi:hypothetical protein